MTHDELYDKRYQAAVMTHGLSADVVYARFEELLLSGSFGGELLDFGAGNGAFTCRMLSTGRFSSVTASDIFERPAGVDQQIHWISGDLNYPLELPDSSFDTIASVEVIEHLENPRAVARELFRLLRHEGRLLLSTPNNESWRALLNLVVRGHYTAFVSNYPAHITALLRMDLERILTETGFVDLSFSYCDHGAVPCFPESLAWRDVSLGCLKGCRFSDTIFVSAKKP